MSNISLNQDAELKDPGAVLDELLRTRHGDVNDPDYLIRMLDRDLAIARAALVLSHGLVRQGYYNPEDYGRVESALNHLYRG